MSFIGSKSTVRAYLTKGLVSYSERDKIRFHISILAGAFVSQYSDTDKIIFSISRQATLMVCPFFLR